MEVEQQVLICVDCGTGYRFGSCCGYESVPMLDFEFVCKDECERESLSVGVGADKIAILIAGAGAVPNFSLYSGPADP